jgi:hypothetical protein
MMNQVASMVGVGGQCKKTSQVHNCRPYLIATPSLTEASCALAIDGVGSTRGYDEDQITNASASVHKLLQGSAKLDIHHNRQAAAETARSSAEDAAAVPRWARLLVVAFLTLLLPYTATDPLLSPPPRPSTRL